VIWQWRALREDEPDYELLFGLVLLATIGAAWLAAPYLDALPRGCVFKLVTGWPCLTCGGTRAVVALASGEVSAALRFNPIVAAGAIGSVLWTPWALMSAACRLPRLRVTLRPEHTARTRVAAINLAAACWLFLVLDGR
jgi:hypothetical protein